MVHSLISRGSGPGRQSNKRDVAEIGTHHSVARCGFCCEVYSPMPFGWRPALAMAMPRGRVPAEHLGRVGCDSGEYAYLSLAA